jgi:hypothetical protein
MVAFRVPLKVPVWVPMPISRCFPFRMLLRWPLFSGLASLVAAPGYVLHAIAVTVAEAPDTLARALVAAPRVVGEVVAPDHVFGVGSGGLLERRVDAKRPQVTVFALRVVQGEGPFLVGVQEDLSPAALPHVSPARGLRRRGVARKVVVAASASATATNKDVRYLIEGAPLLLRLELLDVTR